MGKVTQNKENMVGWGGHSPWLKITPFAGASMSTYGLLL